VEIVMNFLGVKNGYGIVFEMKVEGVSDLICPQIFA